MFYKKVGSSPVHTFCDSNIGNKRKRNWNFHITLNIDQSIAANTQSRSGASRGINTSTS
jgi:hypothetical protein